MVLKQRCRLLCVSLITVARRTNGDLMQEIMSDARSALGLGLQVRTPQTCNVWCHWSWDENCVKPLCGACPMCKEMHQPRPPPTPPALPMMALPSYYFPELIFEAKEGLLYCNDQFFTMVGTTWCVHGRLGTPSPCACVRRRRQVFVRLDGDQD